MNDAAEMTLSPLLEEVLEPITEANPAGEDVSYDDDFLSLKDEIDQLSSVSPEGVDYQRLSERCRFILGRKSKDLRVATYMSMALARMAGYRGIAEGLLALKMLVEHFWDPMYPPLRRMRARQNALQFAAERLSDSLSGLRPAAEDAEAIENAQQALKDLQALTMELMGEQAPVLSGLARALEDASRKVPSGAPGQGSGSAEPTQDAASKPPPSHAGAPGRPSAEASEGAPERSTAAQPPSAAEIRSESEALEQVIGLAGYLRSLKPSDPVSYRLARCARWDAVVDEPTSEAGRTFFEDPAPHRFTYLTTLHDDQDWQTLLEVAEDAFRESPYHFWLDLQRYVVAAMDGLGSGYQQAKEAVLLETAVLVRRVRSLPQLQFLEGAPFADPKTRFWLEETVAALLTSGSANGSAEADQKLEGSLDEARQLASGGKLTEAIHMLQDGIQLDGTRRGRFLRRFNMARICMQAGKQDVACSILENLESEIAAFSLHEWEPELALDVWGQLHQCYGMLTKDESTPPDRIQEKARTVFARICQVDPGRALER